MNAAAASAIHHNRADVLLASLPSLQGATPAPTGTSRPAMPRGTMALAAAEAMPAMAMDAEMAEESKAAGGDAESIRVR